MEECEHEEVVGYRQPGQPSVYSVVARCVVRCCAFHMHASMKKTVRALKRMHGKDKVYVGRRYNFDTDSMKYNARRSMHRRGSVDCCNE